MISLEKLKEFLDSIPQFISDLEPGNDYLKAEGVPENVWKVLNNYRVTGNEEGDGYYVTGLLAVPIYDVVYFPAWYDFKAPYSRLTPDEIYPLFIEANPNLGSKFIVEDFCKEFSDFYLEFLNDAGIDEGLVSFDGELVRLIDSSSSVESASAEDDSDDFVVESDAIVEDETTELEEESVDVESVESEENVKDAVEVEPVVSGSDVVKDDSDVGDSDAVDGDSNADDSDENSDDVVDEIPDSLPCGDA